MQTVKIKAHGEFSATERMAARFDEMKKLDLVKMIATGYEGHADGNAGVGFWRTLPKETLVIVAADMFASDEERAKPQPEPAPTAATAPAPAETTSEPAPIAPAAGGYRLRCTVLTGWLRRDQPRKPGDKPTWRRVEDISKASIYRTKRQADMKLAEVASLYDDRDHQVALEAVSA